MYLLIASLATRDCLLQNFQPHGPNMQPPKIIMYIKCPMIFVHKLGRGQGENGKKYDEVKEIKGEIL